MVNGVCVCVPVWMWMCLYVCLCESHEADAPLLSTNATVHSGVINLKWGVVVLPLPILSSTLPAGLTHIARLWLQAEYFYCFTTGIYGSRTFT